MPNATKEEKKLIMWTAVGLSMLFIVGGWVWSFDASVRASGENQTFTLVDQQVDQFFNQLNEGLDDIAEQRKQTAIRTREAVAPSLTEAELKAFKDAVTKTSASQFEAGADVEVIE